MDACDAQPSASEVDGVYAKPEDLEISPSIRVETKIKLNDFQKDKNSLKFDEIASKPGRNSYVDSSILSEPQEISGTNMTFTEYRERPFIRKPPGKIAFRRPQTVMVKKNYGIVKSPPRRPLAHQFKIPDRLNRIVVMKPNVIKPVVDPHVEISPLQASTEREPENVKETLQVPSIKPHKEMYVDSVKLPLAVNTGFKPESIVIEGGFKPIITKEIGRDNGPEVKVESEIGIIDKSEASSPQSKRFHEILKKNLKRPITLSVKRGRVDEDEEVAAAERVESYYLPPVNKKFRPIDAKATDVAPDTVVTYDGKKLSGQSLTVKFPNRPTVFRAGSSKAAELLKRKPQYGPFRGELPPLDLKHVDKNAPQLRSRGSLNRNLDTPLPSTKLSPIKYLVRADETGIGERKKREAHHTPEHTAEQEAQLKKIQMRDNVNYTTFQNGHGHYEHMNVDKDQSHHDHSHHDHDNHDHGNHNHGNYDHDNHNNEHKVAKSSASPLHFTNLFALFAVFFSFF